ncbi:MAG: PhzF family phenazine biosynthesis protein [Acidimicrobiia bacterium]|nr:PhzF family phenazine biosynthesis protein [Acidimicrobiia bacterium]
MGVPILHVDAFAATPFTGNPAAVCVLGDEEPDDRWMQAVAAEMQLSETAFLRPVDDGWSLRWFSPRTEVDVCGHATLAAAHVLWEQRSLPPDAVARFRTRAGLVTAHLADRRTGGRIEMDFPADPAEPADPPSGLTRALGVPIRATARSARDWLVEVDDQETVQALTPDLALLEQVDGRGVIVTARAAMASFDFVSRFFAPRIGIPEDPVTGSAHCALGPWWAPRLGRSDLVGFQASERGGAVTVRVAGDRVHLGGRAVTVVRGELLDVRS